MQDSNPPGDEKNIVEGKDVYLKEAGCGKPTIPRANLWSDGNKSHIRLYKRLSLRVKAKLDSYTESCAINAADGWRERNVWYPGRSA